MARSGNIMKKEKNKYEKNKKGDVKMNAIAVSIEQRKGKCFDVAESNSRKSKSGFEVVPFKGKVMSQYEKTFLEMTDEEMESLIATMDEK